ncbi:MAG: hypothetical protein V4664_03540 [Patescibacteria group bacterium]
MNYLLWLKIASGIVVLISVNTLLCGWARHSTRKFKAFNWLMDHRPICWLHSFGPDNERLEEISEPNLLNPDETGVGRELTLIFFEVIGILVGLSLVIPIMWPAILWGFLIEPKSPPLTTSEMMR